MKRRVSSGGLILEVHCLHKEFNDERRILPYPTCAADAVELTLIFYFCTAHAQAPLPSPSPTPTPITKTGSILLNNLSTVGRISKWVTSSNNGIGTIGDSGIIESSIGTIGIGTNPFSQYKVAVDGGEARGGLFGRSESSAGVVGFSNSLTGTVGTSASGYGVYGPSNSSTGVYGFSNSENGVLGASPSGNGVFGASQSGNGVYGNSGTGTGVYGQSSSGWAGFFQGRVNVTGLLSAGNISLNPSGNLTFADGTIQSTAAYIKGVTAGTGLTGGGNLGNVTLGIATGGVNTTQLADGSVNCQDPGRCGR